MTIFADASALISIIAGETDATQLTDRLEAEEVKLCSAVSVWETVAGLCHSHMFSVPTALAHVKRFLEVGNVRYVGIGERECEAALDAYAQFGKGRHPAALNMGDCFSYACTKTNQAKLLFKGNDFARTDLAV